MAGGMGEWAGSVRAGAHGGAARAMRGVGQGARVEEAGPPAGAHRVGAGSVWLGGSLAHARFLDPFASKGVPRLSRRGGKTRGARGWWRQRRRGGPRRRGRGDGGGARVWTATTRAVRRSARVGRRRRGGEGGGARGGYRRRWAAAEKRAVTEKAAADIEWNGGTACKGKKGSLPLPPF